MRRRFGWLGYRGLSDIVGRDVCLSSLFVEGDWGGIRISADPEWGRYHGRGQGRLAEVAIGTVSIRSYCYDFLLVVVLTRSGHWLVILQYRFLGRLPEGQLLLEGQFLQAGSQVAHIWVPHFAGGQRLKVKAI